MSVQNLPGNTVDLSSLDILDCLPVQLDGSPRKPPLRNSTGYQFQYSSPYSGVPVAMSDPHEFADFVIVTRTELAVRSRWL